MCCRTGGLEGRGATLWVWGSSPALQKTVLFNLACTQPGARATSAQLPLGSSSPQCAKHVPRPDTGGKGAWKKQLIPWEKQSWDHQSSMAGWYPEEYLARWGASSSPWPLVHPKREQATTEGSAPPTSHPDSIPLPSSHSRFPQLLQCHFEGIQIMSEALRKRFFPSP